MFIFAFSGELNAQNSNTLQIPDLTLHVSQIRAEVREHNIIRLTWTDSPDAKGPVYIYRSARPFSGSIPANIRPKVIRYGMEYDIDEIDDMENIYYFIAASDISGRRYDIFIPRVNSTFITRSLSQETESQTPSVITAQEPAQGISALTARQDGDRVIITYNTSTPRKNAILYRSIQPVTEPRHLLNAVIVQSGFGSQFVDYPVPGITWYYTVIYEDEIAGGGIRILPGINTTSSAVVVSGEETSIDELYINNSMNPLPLPFFTTRDNDPGGFLPDISQQILQVSESVNILKDSQKKEGDPLQMQLKNPRVYAIDLQAPAGGEESALFQIIKEYFEKFDWNGARIRLQRYLSLPRSPDVQARARFYLGQTFYFNRDYKEALFEFLAFRSYNSVEANIWIDAVLKAMIQ